MKKKNKLTKKFRDMIWWRPIESNRAHTHYRVEVRKWMSLLGKTIIGKMYTHAHNGIH